MLKGSLVLIAKIYANAQNCFICIVCVENIGGVQHRFNADEVKIAPQ